MANDTTTDEPPRESLGLPKFNAVPLILAGGIALALAIGLLAFVLAGDDDSSGEPIVLSDEQAPAAQVEEGDPVPDVAFTYFDGSDGSFDDFRGQPVVLNFFAKWCGPCVEEMPGLQSVSEEYAGQVTFVGMDTNDPLEDGQAIVEETGVEYTVARDPGGDIAAAFQLQAMPTTVFIDADGNIVRVWTGAIEPDEVRQIVERYLLA
jgi:thiol-disulfide isomerase/thioredoxin